MHTDTLSQWQHDHDFAVIQEHGEKRTLQVLLLTAVTMVVEIAAGLVFGSMALLADGWHMGTHAAAFSITIFAYRYARKHSTSNRFSFGPAKVSVLGGFASAIALVVVALMMALESIHRLFSPQSIRFNEAIGVAILGLAINLVSALLLQSQHGHTHSHSHEHGHGHHQDHNLRAAYVHVLADAFTSVLAIVALFAGKYLDWHWLDPVMGIVGAGVISKWAHGLLKETSRILLDGSIASEQQEALVQRIESDRDNRVADLHIWKVGPDHLAGILSVVTHDPQSPEYYKALIKEVVELTHVTVEVNTCEEGSCMTPDETTSLH